MQLKRHIIDDVVLISERKKGDKSNMETCKKQLSGEN